MIILFKIDFCIKKLYIYLKYSDVDKKNIVIISILIKVAAKRCINILV